ncbi:hypothetical protein ACMATS_27230 [Streptoverticillium reticulum]|uniref:hypothetical protein n=1 Tax=Streptoverticillium reticulum TaxID=1433415 RepID=UPI0039BEF883
MTAQPEYGPRGSSLHGREPIPRPDRTPEAVRAALARVAPHRLAEMERSKEEALAVALQDGKIGHLQHWLVWWAAQVEIERRPDLSARQRDALEAVHNSSGKDDPTFRRGIDELDAVLEEAKQAVTG